MYIIHKSDGTIAAAIQDGVADRSTSLTLVGKNYTAYGPVIMEDLVKMMEHFALGTPPIKPIIGQLWYDTTNMKLNVFQGSVFRPLNVVHVSEATPLLNRDGDFWFDSANNQLNVYFNSQYNVIYPTYSVSQGKTGPIVQTLTDNHGQKHTVCLMYAQDIVVGIWSPVRFAPSNQITGFAEYLEMGLNILEEGIVNGTAANSLQLNGSPASSFMRTNQDTFTTGNLQVENDDGVKIGGGGDLHIFVDGNGVNIDSTYNGANLNIMTRGFDGGHIPALSFTPGDATFTHNIHGQGANLALDLNVIGMANIDGDSQFQGNVTIQQDTLIAGNVGISNVLDVNSRATLDSFHANTDSNIGGDLSVVSLTVRNDNMNEPDPDAVVKIIGNVRLTEFDSIKFGMNAESEIRGGPREMFITTNGYDRVHVKDTGNVVFTNGVQGPEAIFPNIYVTNITLAGNGVKVNPSDGGLLINSANSSVTGNANIAGNVIILGNLAVGPELYVGSNVTTQNANILSNLKALHANISDATISNLNVTVDVLVSGHLNAPNVNATNLSGTLTGNVYGNLHGKADNATYSDTAGTAATATNSGNAFNVTGSNQPAITGLGHLTSLTMAGPINGGDGVFSGNVYANNVNATTVNGDLVGQVKTPTQTNITGVGALVGLTVNGLLTVQGGGGGNLGSITCDGDIIAYYTSDERLKENIEPITNALDKVNAISGVTFDWNETAKEILLSAKDAPRQVGVMAQQVNAVMPELVVTRPNGYMAVDYEKMCVLLLEAVKELRQQVADLKSQVNGWNF